MNLVNFKISNKSCEFFVSSIAFFVFAFIELIIFHTIEYRHKIISPNHTFLIFCFILLIYYRKVNFSYSYKVFFQCYDLHQYLWQKAINKQNLLNIQLLILILSIYYLSHAQKVIALQLIFKREKQRIMTKNKRNKN